jgi:very-short-patch-repair endonuclease
MKRNKIKCEKCDREISKSNYPRHLKICDGISKCGFKKLEKCPHCKKDLKNIKDTANHVRWCIKNSKRKEYLENLKNIREKGVINGKCGGWNKGLTKETDERVKKFSETISKNTKGDKSYWFNKHQSKKSKDLISDALKLSHKNGKHPGWKHINTDENRRSYPEKWFIENIIKQNNLDKKYTIKEKMPFGKYFLDFAFLELKLDVEIDGQQHNRTIEATEHDRIRDEFLKQKDWIVFRIEWISMKQDITKFLEFIKL